MSGKKSRSDPNSLGKKVVPFEQEKEKFMGMVGDLLSQKDFQSMEEAEEFLNQALVGRSMSQSLAEWDTRPESPLDKARAILDEMPENIAPESERRHAKKALGISRDCMEAWDLLAWSYRSPDRIEATLLEGISHGRILHQDLIKEVNKDHGLWGYHEARPFMRLLESLADFYRQDDKIDEVVKTYEEMIALNPGDNQGIRGLLLHRYLCLQELGKAEVLLEQFPDDIDLGMVYGRVLLELLKVVHCGEEDMESLAENERRGCLTPSSFGPGFLKARDLMKDAMKLNPYVPVLMHHPTTLYLEAPATYQVGFPDQAVTFVTDFGVDWFSSMIGYFFLGAFQKQAKILIRKGRRASRESYRELLDYLKGIDEPPWQAVIHEEMDAIRKSRR